MDKDLIEDKLHELIDQFNERKISHRSFYSALFDNVHSFYERNGRNCKVLFVKGQNFSKTCKTQSKELMHVAWHPTRWYMPEDEKKEIEPIFTDKVGKW